MYTQPLAIVSFWDLQASKAEQVKLCPQIIELLAIASIG